jgi:3-hydroxyisobutyrate dehydrogenase-like beta-hydroxyacid dehydrogenase
MSTGFVGLGAMGFPMAANLSAASEAASEQPTL